MLLRAPPELQVLLRYGEGGSEGGCGRHAKPLQKMGGKPEKDQLVKHTSGGTPHGNTVSKDGSVTVKLKKLEQENQDYSESQFELLKMAV